MGVLTERLWSPAHKSFKARALLYAEKAVSHWPNSALALQNRAFARALVGLHASALEDLAAANALPNNDKAPAWAPLIEAYCNFDAEKLAANDDDSQRVFVRLLQLLAAESSLSDRDIVAAAAALFEASPGCFRAIDSAAQVRQLGIQRTMAETSGQVAQQQLLKQLDKIPQLPPAVLKLLDEWHNTRNAAAANQQDGADSGEVAARLQVIKALCAAGAEGKDRTDPSWRMLAQLLEEVDFIVGWRKLDETANWLGLSAAQIDERVQAIWPLVEHHPYAKFIQSYRADTAQSEQALRDLAKSIDVSRIQYIEEPMLLRLAKVDPGGDHKFHIGYWHEDLIASDLPRNIRLSRAKMTQIPYLRVVSPHMPYGVAQEILHAGAGNQENWTKVEKRYLNSAQVQAALGKFHADNKRWDDSIRCYEAALDRDPAQATFEALAAVYLQKNDEAHWLSTLERYLQTEDFGLGQARVRVNIANHYIELRDWAKARSYAEAAAGTGADWALVKAAQCAEAMQEWNEAEQYYRADSQRYESASLQWYLFCKRNGKGDVNGAEALAFQTLDGALQRGHLGPFDAATVYALAKRDADAAKSFEKGFDKGLNIAEGIYAAVWFDALGDGAARDRILAKVRKNPGNNPKTHPGYRAHMWMATAMTQIAAGGENAKLDLEHVDELAAALSRHDRPYFLYIVAKYLQTHGTPQESEKYLKQCMGFIKFDEGARTLAGAELVARGISPEKFKAAIFEKPTETDNAKGNAGN